MTAQGFSPLKQPAFVVASAGLLVGGALWFADNPGWAGWIWAAATLVVLAELTVSVIRALLEGHMGVDLIALVAMAGALLLGEYLAGAVIALMLSGGQTLESYASARAGRAIAALVERAPRVVHRYENGALNDPDIDQVQPGDLLLVKPGEVVPVDGIVSTQGPVLDESTLTGEAHPVVKQPGDRVHSGTVNAGGPFDMTATSLARDSTYAGIVRLVREARESKAPLTRMADRYAALFLPFSLGLAGLAWFLSGDPVRALAVLVVATPCPLILAAPVALISGLSQAARHGIIIKGGAVLEALAEGNILLLDKTGTITQGAPFLTETVVFDAAEPEECLRLAASLDQVSTHILARALVKEAQKRNLPLVFPTRVVERPGTGIKGKVDGLEVAVGSVHWTRGDQEISAEARRVRRRTSLEGVSNVFLSVDGVLKAAFILEDPVRAESPRTIRALRRTGIERVILLTGDHPDVADVIGAAVGVDEVMAERLPAEKVDVVRGERRRGTTIMVGDGINDAPALAAAHVGIALGARGATASSEAADAVLVVDRLDRLETGIRIAHRSRSIALQSILAGMGLSVGGMLLASAGFLVPVAGALLQEGIDVAVILNALRALAQPRSRAQRPDSVRQAGEQARAEHLELSPKVKHLRLIADRLDSLPHQEARSELEKIRHFLVEELIPHEEHEDSTLYPLVAELIGGDDPTGTMSRAHLEIAHLTRLYVRFLEDLPSGEFPREHLTEFRRVLYGLYALLRLHFAQEEEHYFYLMDAADEGSRLQRSS